MLEQAALSRMLRRLRLRPAGTLLTGTCLCLALVLGALFAPWLAPYGPDEAVIIKSGASLAQAPYPPGTPETLLGSDALRRDMLSRLLHGTRYTLLFCGISATLRVLIGALVGALAAWYGPLGWPLGALASGFAAVPGLIMAMLPMVLINARGTPDQSVIAFVIVLSLTGWPDTMVRVRAAVEDLRGSAFTLAAYTIGLRHGAVLWRHIVPNLRSLLLVELAYAMSATLLLLAELAFVGVFVGGAAVDVQGGRVLAVDTITAEWGNMLALGLRERRRAGWLFMEPLIAFMLAIVGFTMLAEGLRRRIA